MRRAVTIAATTLSVLLFAALAYLAVLGGERYGWTSDPVRDDATDAVTFNFLLASDDGEAMLRVTCRPNERIAVILTADAGLGQAGPAAAMRLRFDRDQPVERPVPRARERLALADPADPRSLELVTRLAASHRLELEIDRPDGEDRFRALFHTVGADDVIGDLRRSCI